MMICFLWFFMCAFFNKKQGEMESVNILLMKLNDYTDSYFWMNY